MSATALLTWFKDGTHPWGDEARAQWGERRRAAESALDAILAAPLGSAAAVPADPAARGMFARVALARAARIAHETFHTFDQPWDRCLRLAVEALAAPTILDEADAQSAVLLVQPLLSIACRTWPRRSNLVPWRPVLDAVGRRFQLHGRSEPVVAALRHLRKVFLLGHPEAFERNAAERIDVLLGEDDPLVPAAAAWSDAALADLARLDPEARAAWDGLLAHARSLRGNAASARWRKHAVKLAEAAGRDVVLATIAAWLAQVAPPSPLPRPGYGMLIPNRPGDLLRGLAFVLASIGGPGAARAIGDLGARCLKKVPAFGPLSAKVGNACITALGELAGNEAVAQIERLRHSVRYAAARRLIDKALNAVADRTGLTRADLAELAVPTFGLEPGGRLLRQVGPATAEVRIAGTTEVTLTWTSANGRLVKGSPAEAKSAAPGDVAELRKLVKEIASVLPGQRDRIEALAVEGRSWSLPVWRERYLDHPLLSGIARRLIWRFEGCVGEGALGIWREGGLVGVDGRPLADLGDVTRVSPWHPLGAPAESVAAWRTWLVAEGVTQPWKQAYREVYALTDAERTTRTYSERFGGHIVRQHQLAALCRARGWQYRLQGEHFDGANDPTLVLPDHDLRVVFGVDIGESDLPASDAGIALTATTGAAGFYDLAGAPRALADLPPILLSEVLRDLDLFVSVGGVGADPLWRERGPGAHRAYWETASFGELGPGGETRRDVLTRLVPKLRIASRCAIEGRYLVVRGDLRTYKIHLGSGNIRMEPNDAYLCIVPAAARDEGPTLPFEGDATLSLILSKAILLAEDARLKDPSILSQIRQGGM
jgi:hypothetical protein